MVSDDLKATAISVLKQAHAGNDWLMVMHAGNILELRILNKLDPYPDGIDIRQLVNYCLTEGWIKLTKLNPAGHAERYDLTDTGIKMVEQQA